MHTQFLQLNLSILCSLVFVMLQAGNLFAQPQTEHLQRLDVNFTDVTFAGDGLAFIVGNHGTILRSTDEGMNWERQFGGTLAPLFGVDFVDQEHGVIVGNDGTLLRSMDGGVSWRILNTNWTNDLLSISFGSESNGILVGSEGFAARTDDGGTSWQRVNVPTDSTLHEVLMVSENVAIAIGGNGTIIRTEDAGQSWERVFHGAANCIDCIIAKLALNKSGGVYALFAAHLMYSGDQGRTWEVEQSPRNDRGIPLCHTVSAPTNRRAALVGTIVSAFYTENRGREYKKADVAQWEVTQTVLTDIEFRDEQNGIAVGAFNSIYLTDDGGLSWRLRSYIYLVRHDRWNLQFFDSKTGFVAGPHERIFRTNDGGATWQYQRENPEDTAYSASSGIANFHFFDRENSVALSDNVIGYLESSSGWRNFERKYVPSGRQPLMDFNGRQDGITVGRWNDILWIIRTTRDGGTTWKTESTIEGLSVFDAEWLTSDKILLGTRLTRGENEVASILQSNDQGKSWLEKDVEGANVVTDIEFVSPSTGFAALGYDGPTGLVESAAIVKTDDGGASWELTSDRVNSTLISVSFADEQTGYATGSAGAVIKTVDGGQSWELLPTGHNNLLPAVQALRDGSAFILGTGGTIFRTLPPDQIVSVNGNSKVEDLQPPTFWTEEPFPNPFSNTISIPLVWFSDYANQAINIDVYDMLGNHIEDLRPQINSQTGGRTATIVWEPQDLLSGVYIINFEFDGYTRSETVFYMQ